MSVIIIILVLWLAVCFVEVRFRQISADEGIFAELRQHSASQSVAENFRQDLRLYLPIPIYFISYCVNVNAYGNDFLYVISSLIAGAASIMTVSVMIYFILTRDIRMNLLYLALLVSSDLIIALIWQDELDTMILNLVLPTVAIWVILYATARFVRVGRWRSALLLVLYYAFNIFLMPWIMYGHSSVYVEKFIAVAAAAAFLYWLTKYKAAAEVYEL